jgi:hypothetical protein
MGFGGVGSTAKTAEGDAAKSGGLGSKIGGWFKNIFGGGAAADAEELLPLAAEIP